MSAIQAALTIRMYHDVRQLAGSDQQTEANAPAQLSERLVGGGPQSVRAAYARPRSVSVTGAVPIPGEGRWLTPPHR